MSIFPRNSSQTSDLTGVIEASAFEAGENNLLSSLLSVTAPDLSFVAASNLQIDAPQANLVPDDTLYLAQWHFRHMSDFDDHQRFIEIIWDEFLGEGVAVGVYDSGIEYTHEDLAGNYDASKHVIVTGIGVHDPFPNQDPLDDVAHHGTAVAGLIAAEKNNIGVIGVAGKASLTGVNIFFDQINIGAPESEDEEIVEGIRQNFLETLDQLGTFDVVNHSWSGGVGFDQDLANDRHVDIVTRYETALETGRNGLGALQVQSAGNSPEGSENSNGYFVNASRATVTVGAFAVSETNHHIPAAAKYSNHGANIFISAPGSGDNFDPANPEVPYDRRLVTTDMEGADGYESVQNQGNYSESQVSGFGGTSAAAPLITGSIALMLEANENLGWRDIQKILAYSAVEMGSGIGASTLEQYEDHNWYYNDASNWNGGGLHFSEDYGYGAVDVYNAVRMAEVWSLFGTAQVSGNEDTFSASFSGSNIPDNGTLSENLVISGNFELEHVALEVDITHSDLTDLRMTLTSPGGTVAQLFREATDANSSTADNGWVWSFGINSFRGELAVGTWTLTIQDTQSGDSGALNGVTFTGYGRDGSSASVSLDNHVYHYTDEIFDALADDTSRQTITDTTGEDWLNLSALTGDIVVDLSTGTFTSSATSFLSLATGTVIEHAVSGDGNDTITGDSGNNRLYGMRGTDIINGGDGNDTIGGGAGADVLSGGNGTDLLDYSFDRTGIIVDLELMTASGGNAQGDIISAVEGVIGGEGDDILTGSNGQDILKGGAGADTITGGAGADTITGGAGNDIIIANGADDIISGDSGDDHIEGRAGRDNIDGGTGNDTLIGGDNPDVIFGGDGDDQIEGRPGSDTLHGGAGNDTLIGNGLVDTIFGDDGDDIISAGGGDDIVDGGTGSDNIVGGVGNDILDGGAGDDDLFGGKNNDVLSGGSGTDELTGGNNADTFIFSAGHEMVTILDFKNDEDTLDLSSFGFTIESQATALMSESGGDVTFSLNGDILVINNITIADLQDDIMI